MTAKTPHSYKYTGTATPRFFLGLQLQPKDHAWTTAENKDFKSGATARMGLISLTSPEFILMFPHLSPAVTYIVEPLAATRHVGDVSVAEDRETQYVLQQLGRKIGQLFAADLGKTPVRQRVFFSIPRRGHLYCLHQLPHCSGTAPFWCRGLSWGWGEQGEHMYVHGSDSI